MTRPQHDPVVLELVDTHPDGQPVTVAVGGSLAEVRGLLNSPDRFVFIERRESKRLFVINTDRVASAYTEGRR